ncbi:hypothetical protein N7508_009035 [Penicillium antarcticum]|uniref:uncharacterized protein n=1 Tax=Penicillium antarcticum TaxID=416450 RepID=UPI0023A34FB5|nr:uncharacterized protein N7508_009035 [Penicillium antarcticum]KAJ5294214.1 hypothetical protein N7508_009035 [Penicillium antarcticum]
MVEILSARPPTPPRTASRSVDENRTESAVQTPKESPFVAFGSAGAISSNRSSKRVNFSPWPNFIKPPTFTSASKSVPDLKSNPPSTDSKPAKSILKATQSPIPVWSPNVDTFTTESLAMLLESVIQQLAGESLSSRLDAYMQFFGALRTYDGLPAGQDIAEKLNIVTEFIQRDVNRDLANGEPMDTNLANQALKLSAAFVWHADISTQLSDDFKIFLVDHSINCLNEAKVPKSVLSHYMSILSTQNFGAKIMTGARITRLLTVLQDITKNIPGNAIISHRLNIYQRLLSQAKSGFITQTHLWIEHLISGLLHHLKDTRSKAIALGFQITAEAGPNPILSKNIRELFDRTLEHDRKLVTEIRERMARMMSSVESGVHVPQIWSIIILLLRSKRWNLEQWDHFKEWVLVLQKCFNCSEAAIKAQAIVGWNRFIYAVGPSDSTSRSLLKMLGKPVLSQFDRKKSDKAGSPPTQLALTSYHSLLYYTFRPSASSEHLDIIWEEYVLVPSSGIFSTVPALSDCLSRILTNILWSTQAKLWTEGRINDTNKIEAEELPAADSRWVRSRISSILKVFENLFKSSVWVDTAIESSHIAMAWINLSNALSLASSKEITPSGESMQAVAGVLGLLHRLWTTGPPSLNAVGNDTNLFFERFRFLSTTMIVALGGIPFTEKLLLRSTDETFQTATTPTHRHTQPGTNLNSPILHLLRTITSSTGTVLPTESYARLVMGTIEAACNSRISRGSRLELLRQCVELSTAETTALPRAHPLSEVVWKSAAQAASNALRSFPIESARERDGSVSRDYENAIKILTFGLAYPAVFSDWSHLLDSFVHVVRTEKGNQAIATMIVEPMAEHLMVLPAGDTYLPSTSLFCHSLSIPFLQGTGLGIARDGIQSVGHSLFPHKLIESISRTLCGAYDEFKAPGVPGLADFIEALTSFLGSGIPQFRSRLLQSLESPLSVWLEDKSYKIDVDSGVDSRIITACRALSSAGVSIIQASITDNLSIVSKFQATFCAGLKSSHTSISKRFVELWHSTFDSQPTVCPDSILEAVQTAEFKLQSIAPPLDGDQDTEMLPPPAPERNNRRRGKLGASQDTLNSSPVVRTQESIASNGLNEPQLPSNFQLGVPDTEIFGGAAVAKKRRNRREVFSMIESIQSSSPANSPRKLGFNTPPHLRRLQSSESASEIPITPTLAPTENEEGFIGSSPTPATRDPTPAVNTDTSVSALQDSNAIQGTDLPSSPPEIHSRSPSPSKGRKQSRSARRKAAKAAKVLAGPSGKQSTVNSPATSRLATEERNDAPTINYHDQDKENADATPRAISTTASRRLRSGLNQEAATSQDLSHVDVPDSQETPVQKPVRKSKSNSSSKKKKQASPQPAAEENQQLTDPPPDINLPDAFMDSGEEVDTQIQSQLEQDLEFAVDMDGQPQSKPSTTSSQQSTARKRKRVEEEPSASKRNDRRRSTRLTTGKDGDGMAEDLDDSRSQGSTVTEQIGPVSSPTATRRSARHSQRKVEENPPAEVVHATQGSVAEEPTEDTETPRPSKRSRKSLRLDEQRPSTAVELGVPSDTIPEKRKRKTRSQQNMSQPSAVSSEVLEQVQPHDGDQDVVPESFVAEDQAVEQSIPYVSTEAATDSQMSDIHETIEPAPAVDTKMEMDDAIPSQQPEQPANPATPATPGTQIEDTSTGPQTHINEASITQSLRTLLGDMKLATLDPNSIREVDDLLFHIRVESLRALDRHNNSA